MVNLIYAKQVRALALLALSKRPIRSERTACRRRQKFLSMLIITTWLTACTVHAAPPVPPPVTCMTPVKLMVAISADANGDPVEGPIATFSPQICACTDGTVKVCGQ